MSAIDQQLAHGVSARQTRLAFAKLHTGERCCQLFAYCTPGTHTVPGDPVASLDGQRRDDFQIVMIEGGFVTIRDGVLVGWKDTPAGDLECFTHQGAPAGLFELERGLAGPDPSDVAGQLAVYGAVSAQVAAVYVAAALGGDTQDERREQVRQAAYDTAMAEKRDSLLGLPHRCTHCAAMVAGRSSTPAR